MTRAVFFDLFFTLINPRYSDKNEYDVVGMSSAEWEQYAEEENIYLERALGRVKTEKQIIEKITERLPCKVTEEQKQLILLRREERMKRALVDVDDLILGVLQELHNSNIKLGLISNADIIDTKYWEYSPLARYFDSVLFSCNTGILKPDVTIYHKAMKELGVHPSESIFIGDGGSNELYGAKMAGMKTILTEYLETKTGNVRECILPYADHTISRFDDMLKYL
jgi:putative hydrolase of the HAD superfamily